MKYRKKPVVIDAVLNDNSPAMADQVTTWNPNVRFYDVGNGDQVIDIPTLEGVMTASPGDWIIKGVNGEIYPCKPDIFEKTYEKVEE